MSQTVPMTLTDFLLARITADEAFVQREEAADMHPSDRTRVLAECEAKRRIVEMFSGNLHEKWDDGYEADKMAAPTLRALALPYADHPDYRTQWRP